MEISNRLLFVSQKSTMLTFSGYKCGVTLFSISHAAKSICSNFSEDRIFLSSLSTTGTFTGSYPQALKVMVHGHWYNH